MILPALRPVYTVAGHAAVCDWAIPALAPLRSDRPPDFAICRGSLSLPPTALGVFDGQTELGTRCCRVRSLTTPAGDLLQISGAGVFSIPRGQARIDVDPEPGAGEDAVTEALLGPALALALARKGTFLLHASAVALPGGGVTGFLGDSGAGKSTLARLLVEAGEGAALAADDLLAVQQLAEGAAALPHFPQLKLDPAAMAALASLAPRLPLRRLYVLEPAPPAAAVDAGEALTAAGAAAHLIRHTIAGRLFAADLLAAHLAFVARIAGRVPVHRLTVPRRLDVGGQVLQAAATSGAS